MEKQLKMLHFEYVMVILSLSLTPFRNIFSKKDLHVISFFGNHLPTK